MTLSILVVEDSSEKAISVMNAISQIDSSIRTIVCNDIVSAKRELESIRFDAAIIDIQIPIRFPDIPDPAGGGKLIREIEGNSKLKRPRYIVGLSEYADADQRCGQALSERAFGFIHYQRESDAWRQKLVRFIDNVIASSRAGDKDNPTNTDLLIICALDDPELAAVRRLPYGWKESTDDGDCITYFEGLIDAASGKRSVVSAAALEPGMAAAAALCSRAIMQFHPRYVVMTGITGGRRNETNLGDIVAAEVVWDYTNGKHSTIDGKAAFRPSPRVIDVDPVIVSQLKRVGKIDGLLDGIYRRWPAARPQTALELRSGPIFTGTTVVANAEMAESLLQMNRKVVGIEMEAYSVMCATKFAPHPRPTGFIIKSVSDFADEHKDDDWQPYASYTSAAFLHEWATRFL